MMKKISVSCMGSRERYGLPVALHQSGLLQCLYTDIYCPAWITSLSSISALPSPVRALLGRNHKDLPLSKVDSQYLMGFNFRLRVRRALTLFEKQELLLDYGSVFSREVAKNIVRADEFVGFTGESLEAIRVCKERGIKATLDQVDAGLYDWELISREVDKNPGWELSDPDTRWSRRFEKRAKNELELADEIIVNSQYSKDAMAYWGISGNVQILPIASSTPRKQRTQVNMGTLRILFLGVLSLRKGIHIALAAVDRLVKRGFKVELILAGESIIRAEKLNEYQGWKYLGPVPSSAVPALIDSCDVLLFPTFSDGFGMVQVEAISRGMPVISTKNAAQVIENGVSGFVVEIGSVDEVVHRVEQYCVDRELLLLHSINAFDRSAMFTPKTYQQLVYEKFS